ncbi:MAG: ACT domain-containing protein [Thermodesulfobacteriota bacterium]|nr:ACT domain-containing protein [Thermodesulfobacteriota bacterium]
MHKLIITILGKDRPGIITAVAKSLYRLDCNLENVNQMILQNEFAGLFIVEPPDNLDKAAIKEKLKKDLKGSGLHIHVNTIDPNGNTTGDAKEELFLITTIGPDQKGLVARITEIIAKYNVNVTNLKAVFKGGDDPKANIMSYEVAITPENDQAGLFSELRKKADELQLEISIQHKNIFKTINKI